MAWTETKQGVSDLRRFWDYSSEEIDSIPFDELEAYYDTLPPESATITQANKLRGGDLSHLLMAGIKDEILSLRHGMAGKRVPKDAFMMEHFLADSRRAQTEAFAERVKARRVAEKRAKQVGE